MSRLLLRLLLVAVVGGAIFAGGQTGHSTSEPGSGDLGGAGQPSPPEEEGIPLSELFGASCMMPDEGQAAGRQAAEGGSTPAPLGGDVPPTRLIEDPYPSFNGVAVDPESNLAFLSDTNRKSLLVYDQTAGGKTAAETPPRQHI